MNRLEEQLSTVQVLAREIHNLARDSGMTPHEVMVALKVVLRDLVDKSRAPRESLRQMQSLLTEIEQERWPAVPAELDLLRVVAEITEGRDRVFQVTLRKLAAVCEANGLFGLLPSLAQSGMEDLWRKQLTEAFTHQRWTLRGRGGKTWRIRCPQGGNFWVEPSSSR